MAKKPTEVVPQWAPTAKPIPIKQFVEDTADTRKMIVFAESNAGKTHFWMLVFQMLKELVSLPPEKVLICAVYPDRRTGITKLVGLIPKEYFEHGCLQIFPVTNYEELVSATATAEKMLADHYAKTGVHGWLIHELLGEPWVFAQDYYTRKSYGEGLADYFATKKQLDKAVREDASAYRALDGWKDWSVIKLFHNFGWIDKIKLMPFNVLATAEIRPEANTDSIFSKTGRPAGEKDNMHRFDEIVFLRRDLSKAKFFMRPLKLTGYTHVYPEQDITGKNPLMVHMDMLKKLEKSGYKEKPIAKLEKKANIIPPKKPKEEPATESKPAKPEPKTKTEKPPKTGDDDSDDEGW